MNRVSMTTFPELGDPKGGNAFAACLASLLGVELAQVPDFNHLAGESGVEGGYSWFNALNDWLKPSGLHCVFHACREVKAGGDVKLWTPIGFYIEAGNKKRENAAGEVVEVEHFVIASGGVNHHDPHPEETGIDAIIARFFFVAHDLAAMGEEIAKRGASIGDIETAAR